MPTYDMTGTVKMVMDPMTFDSGFNKREFVVTSEEDRFPQDIKFECIKDKASLLDGIEPGQRVTVSFDVRGNEYKGRYFVNLSAWRIEPAAETSEPDVVDGPPLDQREPPPEEDPDAPF